VYHLLLEFGFSAELALEAIAARGGDPQKCLNYCLQPGDVVAQADSMADEELDLLVSMGFHRDAASKALHHASQNFANALELLLCGAVVDTVQSTSPSTSSGSGHALAKSDRRLSSAPRRGEWKCSDNFLAIYRAKAQEVYPCPAGYTVYDLGVRAATRTNSCLWLSLAAAWAHCSDNVRYSDPMLVEIAKHLPEIRQQAPEKLRLEHRKAFDAVGVVADRLRPHFCASGGVLPGQAYSTWAAAFAALTRGVSGAATPEHYKRWLCRVAESEFADELIVSAVAQHMQLHIVVVPAQEHWQVSEYGTNSPAGRRVVLGNNDVHFVWLHGSV